MGERKTKVAFLISSSVFSGGDRHLVEIIRRLDFSKVEPVVLCFGADPLSRVLNGQLHLGVRVKTGRSRKSFFRNWLALRNERADIVVLVNGGVGTFPWYAFLAARLSGATRVLAIYHNFSTVPELPSRNRNLFSYIARRMFGWRVRVLLSARAIVALTDRSICVSNNLREQLVTFFGYPQERTVTVLNGVDLGFFGMPDSLTDGVRRELGIGPQDVVVVSACRLVVLKGVDVLLQAVNLLREEVPNLKCVIVGEGPSEEELRKASVEMGLSSKVFFVGFKDDTRPYLQMGDIFVNSSSASYVECLPFSVLEAMASGLPCIGSNAGGVPELISDKVDGLLVTPGSVDDMCRAIKRLSCNHSERKRMGELAREKVHRHFDLDQCMDRLKTVLLQ
ncbi:MAG TPA: glycosyltransferase family 4 protein [Terriglobia bacterium]|nr:glycosyltransferase family 4 protein [Terriglobia bacterium]